MKKYFKMIMLSLCACVSALIFSACTEEADKVAVTSISLDKQEITLYVSDNDVSSDEFKISYRPANANQTDIEFFAYNQDLIEISQKQGTGDTFVVTAKSLEGSEADTYIGVRMKGNADVQNKCHVIVKKLQTKLNKISGLKYNEELGQLEWDATTNTLEDGFLGYKLLVNGEEIVVPQGTCYYTNLPKGKKLTVQVKAISGVNELDSEYSEQVIFKLLADITNFKHENGVFSWDLGEDVYKYSFQINSNTPETLSATTSKKAVTFSVAGEYTFRLTAIGGTNSDLSVPGGEYRVYNATPVYIKVTKLATPENLSYQKVFTWSAVVMDNGAVPENYEIYEVLSSVDTFVEQTTGISFTLPSDLSSGSHSYKVRAIGDGINTITSDFSAVKTINKLQTPTNLRVENGVLTWDKDDNAKSYKIEFSGYYNNGTSNTFYYDREIDVIANSLELGSNFNGDYTFAVASVSDAENTADSDYTSGLSVTKLIAPSIANFTVLENKLVWQAVENASKYEISLTIDGETSIDTTNQNEYSLPQLSAGEISYQIKAIGNSSSQSGSGFLTSDYSTLAYAQKLASPTLSLKNGVLKWTSVANSSGYVLNINGEEIQVKSQTSFSFEDYPSANYNVRVKALGGNANSNSKYLVGSFSSQYSPALALYKYMAPSLYLENGQIKVTNPNIDNSSSDDESQDEKPEQQATITWSLLQNGSLSYVAYYVGDNESNISSNYSDALVVWQATDVSGLAIKNQIASWDNLSSKYSGAIFQVDCEYTDLEGEVTTTTLVQNTSNTFDFSDETTYPAGTYKLSVQVIGTSGTSGNLVLSSKNISYITFERLPQPTVSALGAFDVVKTGKLENLPGTLTWTPSKINTSVAVGYTIRVKDENGEVIKSFDQKTNRLYSLPDELDAGTYQISVEAYGNESNLLNSGYAQDVIFTKLSQVTNVQIDNQGILTWESEYNAENSITQSALFGSVPANLRVLFVVEVDGEYYNPYTFDGAISGNSLNYDKLAPINSLRSININSLRRFNGVSGDQIYLSNNNHSVRIITLPINYVTQIGGEQLGYSCDLYSNATEYLTFTKLEQPYGLKVERNSQDDHYIINFTASLDSNVSGYELVIKNNNKSTDITTIDLNGINSTTFDFTQHMIDKGITSGSYSIKVRAVSTVQNVIASYYTEELKIVILEDINLQIDSGMFKWNQISNAEKYIFTITNDSYTFTREFKASQTSYEFLLENDSRFVSGTYNIKVRVIGAESSNYTNVIYIDALNYKDYGNFVKLDQVTGLKVSSGEIVFNHIDPNGELSGYQYYIYVTTNGKTTIEKLQNFGSYLINGNTQISYELPEKYGQGDYSIQVQAKGLTAYLDGEISDNITPEIVKKLEKTSVYINSGILNWNAVEGNGYLVKISGAKFYIVNSETSESEFTNDSYEFEIKVESGTTALDISKQLTSITNQQFLLANGKYSVKIKVLGTNVTYLNSNYSDEKYFIKLATPKNVRVQDGMLKWDKLTNTECPNGLVIYISSSDGSVKNQVVIGQNSTTSFDFAGSSYLAGKFYSFYLRTIGDTKLNSSSFTTGYIAGDPSVTISNIEKLIVPQNPRVIQSSDDSIGAFTFDKLGEEYQDIQYAIKITAISGSNQKSFDYTLDTNIFNLSTLSGIDITANTEITITARAFGGEKYINSEYTDNLTIIIPPTPQLSVDIDEYERFTGKVEWTQVVVGDFTTKYQLTYQFLDINTATSLNIKSVDEITEAIWSSSATEKTIETENLYYNISGKGYYRFKICALISGHDSIKSTESEYTKGYDFCLFTSGNGTELDPFVIDSATSFNFIAFNLSAHYKLSKDIDFSGITLTDIGSESNPFNGSLNGNGYSLYNIRISKVNTNSSIFDYVGESGKISNLNVYNITITNGTNVGGIVGYNQGTIQNVVVGAISSASSLQYDSVSSISPYSSSVSNSYVGGIVGYNQGRIENSKNYAIIAPKNDNAEVASGGIAGYNSGTITKSFNYNNVGGLGTYSSKLENLSVNSNMSGGIIGYNTNGTVSYCGNYGNVFASSRNTASVSQAGYAGGIVGYMNKGKVSNSFNDNSNKNYTQSGLKASTAIYATTSTSKMGIYVGGLVGKSINGSSIMFNWSISNIQFDINGTSATTHLGTIFGNNESTTIANIKQMLAFALDDSTIKVAGELVPQNSNINSFTSSNKDISEFMKSAKNCASIIDDSTN